MKALLQSFAKEHYHYQSEKSADEFKADLIAMLQKNKGWDFSLNLTGEIKDGNRFRLTPRWQGYMDGASTSEAIINGHIEENPTGQAIITFSVKPGFHFLLIFIPFSLAGLIFSYKGVETLLHPSSSFHKDWEMLAVGIASILFGLWSTLWASTAKTDLRNRFVETFKLKPLPHKTEP